MEMNIIMPILINLAMIVLLTIGFFIGKRNGWKIQSIKVLTLGLSGVIAYFGGQQLAKLVWRINGVAEFFTSHGISQSLFALIFVVVLTLFIYCISILIEKKCYNKNKFEKYNVVQRLATVIDSGTTKKIKNKNRNINDKFKKTGFSSKLIGGMLGIILGFVICGLILLPFVKIFTIPGIEYTVYKYVFCLIGLI